MAIYYAWSEPVALDTLVNYILTTHAPETKEKIKQVLDVFWDKGFQIDRIETGTCHRLDIFSDGRDRHQYSKVFRNFKGDNTIYVSFENDFGNRVHLQIDLIDDYMKAHSSVIGKGNMDAFCCKFLGGDNVSRFVRILKEKLPDLDSKQAAYMG